MKLELRRDIVVECFEGLISISRGEKQDHLLSVIMLANENGGAVTPELVCEKLLPNRPKSVGEAVIKRCSSLDLLDENGRISTQGKVSLGTGQVFIPEQDRYAVYFTDDPLIEQKIIDIYPVGEPILKDSLENARSKNKAKKGTDSVLRIPDSVINLEGKVFQLLGGNRDTVRLLKFESTGSKVSVPKIKNVSAALTLDGVNSTKLQLSGDIGVAIKPPDVNFEKIWQDVLKEKRQLWNTRNDGRLGCHFEELNDAELNTFVRTMKFDLPDTKELGVFASATATDVPVAPASLIDANKWANRLLISKIDAYTWPTVFEGECYDVVKTFVNMGYRIQLPSQAELAKCVRDKKVDSVVYPNAKYWFLQAPLDFQESPPPNQSLNRSW
ncbi:MAG: hypothetical protein JRN15_14625 [Nitrososphaerota archaeon]|nr:hypothetical protein [Nitrososphaerota archaeon]